MKVRCPICRTLDYETTDRFDADVLPHGGMLTLVGEARAMGMPKFGDRGEGGEELDFADLECTHCQAQLAPEGRLTVLTDEELKTVAEKGTEQVMGIFHPVASAEDIKKIVEGLVTTNSKETFTIDEPLKDLPESKVSKADQIRHLLSTKMGTQQDIANIVGTSPAYVSNVARKMREENG